MWRKLVARVAVLLHPGVDVQAGTGRRSEQVGHLFAALGVLVREVGTREGDIAAAAGSAKHRVVHPWLRPEREQADAIMAEVAPIVLEPIRINGEDMVE